MKVIAQVRRRFGDRRIYVLLEYEGFLANRQRLFRLYREQSLTVSRHDGRNRAMGSADEGADAAE